MIRSGWTQLPHEAVCSGLQSVLHTVDRTEDDAQNTKGKENNKTGISHTMDMGYLAPEFQISGIVIVIRPTIVQLIVILRHK